MKLSQNAQNALNKVVKKFESGDLSVVTEVIRIKLLEDRPAASWTLGNQVLAYIQTGSLDCRGYKQWEEVSRHVKRGCRAAYILAPRLVLIEDELTGTEKKTLCGFFGVPVFAYHDTGGDTLAELSYAPRELPPLMEAAERLGVEVTWQPWCGGTPPRPCEVGSLTIYGSWKNLLFWRLPEPKTARLPKMGNLAVYGSF